MTRSIIALSILALGATACSNKPEPRKIAPEEIDRRLDRVTQRWDVNGDGVATCDDLQLYWKDIYDRLNTNGDDHLDTQEFSGAVWIEDTFRIVRFDIVDKDRNKMITEGEFTELPNSDFGRLDKDGDCLVDRKDIQTLLAERGDKQKRAGGRGGKGGKGGGRGRDRVAD